MSWSGATSVPDSGTMRASSRSVARGWYAAGSHWSLSPVIVNVWRTVPGGPAAAELVADVAGLALDAPHLRRRSRSSAAIRQ